MLLVALNFNLELLCWKFTCLWFYINLSYHEAKYPESSKNISKRENNLYFAGCNCVKFNMVVFRC